MAAATSDDSPDGGAESDAQASPDPAGADLPAELAADVAAVLPRIRDLVEPPAREVGVEAARRRFGTLLGRGLAGGPGVPSSEVALDDGLTGRVYRPATGAPTQPTLVFLHGGGWTLGTVAEYDGLARRLAHGTRATVLSVEYRRAPEHPFPAAVDDAVAATRWALRHAPSLGGDPARVAVAGDSGGGNLAAVVCQQLHAAGGPGPAAQLLLYPNVARGADFPSVARYGHLPFLALADMAWYTRQYLPRGTDLGDPRISPLEGHLAGLPPTLIATAEVDPLRDSGREYAEAIRAHAGPVEWLELPGLPHGFAHLVALSRSCAAGLDRVLDRFRVLLHGSD